MTTTTASTAPIATPTNDGFTHAAPPWEDDPIPYVCGFAFTEEQVRLYAEQVLTPEELLKAQREDAYQRELVFHFRKREIPETFLPFFAKPNHRTPHYLWVLVVLPGSDDEAPTLNINKDRMKALIMRKGPEFATAWVHCMKWPDIVCRAYYTLSK